MVEKEHQRIKIGKGFSLFFFIESSALQSISNKHRKINPMFQLKRFKILVVCFHLVGFSSSFVSSDNIKGKSFCVFIVRPQAELLSAEFSIYFLVMVFSTLQTN